MKTLEAFGKEEWKIERDWGAFSLQDAAKFMMSLVKVFVPKVLFQEIKLDRYQERLKIT